MSDNKKPFSPEGMKMEIEMIEIPKITTFNHAMDELEEGCSFEVVINKAGRKSELANLLRIFRDTSLETEEDCLKWAMLQRLGFWSQDDEFIVFPGDRHHVSGPLNAALLEELWTEVVNINFEPPTLEEYDADSPPPF